MRTVAIESDRPVLKETLLEFIPAGIFRKRLKLSAFGFLARRLG